MSERAFEVDGEQWIARLAGGSAAGSGALGLGMLEGVDFALAAEPARPLREVLFQRGRFDNLFDEEIVAMFRMSHAITPRVMTRKSLEDAH
jgi:hypothetical protein